MVNSCIYTGSVYHKRFLPVTHEFKYPVYFFSLDLAELDQLDQTCFGFSVNAFNLFSFHESDYLYGYEGSLFERVKLGLQYLLLPI